MVRLEFQLFTAEPSNLDTNGTEETDHISEVSLLQGLKKLFFKRSYLIKSSN